MGGNYKKSLEKSRANNRRDKEVISQLKRKVTSNKDSFLTKNIFLNSILYSLGIAEVAN